MHFCWRHAIRRIYKLLVSKNLLTIFLLGALTTIFKLLWDGFMSMCSMALSKSSWYLSGTISCVIVIIVSKEIHKLYTVTMYSVIVALEGTLTIAIMKFLSTELQEFFFFCSLQYFTVRVLLQRRYALGTAKWKMPAEAKSTFLQICQMCHKL